MRTIGVLGGMGSYASLQFFDCLLKNTESDTNRPHILINNATNIPSRTRAVLYNEESPVKQTIIEINNLEKAGADFIVCPCNSLHYWYKEISEGINIPWINMIEVVSKKSTGNTLILGGYITSKMKLYNEYISCTYLDNQKLLNDLISDIKKYNTSLLQYKLVKEIRGVEEFITNVILACTELSIIKRYLTNMINVPVIDSSYEYAKETIKYANE